MDANEEREWTLMKPNGRIWSLNLISCNGNKKGVRKTLTPLKYH